MDLYYFFSLEGFFSVDPGNQTDNARGKSVPRKPVPFLIYACPQRLFLALNLCLPSGSRFNSVWLG